MLEAKHPVHTTPKQFENAGVFLQLGLPSTLIYTKNETFPKRSSNREEFENVGFNLFLRVDCEHFENGGFRKQRRSW